MQRRTHQYDSMKLKYAVEKTSEGRCLKLSLFLSG